MENSSNPKGTSSHSIDTDKRHYLTKENIAELGITWEVLEPLLNARLVPNFNPLNIDARKFSRETRKENGKPSRSILPDGISINGVKFGNYPDSTPAANELGWITYMVIGEPLVEESAKIIPPSADLLSTRSYVNRGKKPTNYEDSVKFSISNTISWSLEGSGSLTFGGRASGTSEKQNQKSAQFTSQSSSEIRHINHNHKDNQGTQDQTAGTATKMASETITGTGTASGTGEVFSQLELGVTGSTSGSLTTSWESTSSVSGEISPGSRVETMATQRRQIRQFNYELPITLSGFISLHYPEPVLIEKNYTPPQDSPKSSDAEEAKKEEYSQHIAYDIYHLSLYGDNNFLSKGIAEIVSSLDVEHTIFEEDKLSKEEYHLTRKRPRDI
ncbi:TPA: hypothetical protein I9281_003933 [Serratia marcescens]|nr:hypothetical protein [Serratia marcescens]